MFEMLGIEGRGESGSGRQAAGHQANIDLILLDMMMPEIDGIEACRIIQRHEHLKDIPIIMVTAVGDSKKMAEALDAGAVDYVTKPINKVELMARIRLALRLKKENDWHKERDQRIKDELRLAALVQNAVLSPRSRTAPSRCTRSTSLPPSLPGICTRGIRLAGDGTASFCWT